MSPTPNSLPYSAFDTSVLPRDQQFSAWREAVSVIFDTQTAESRDAGFGTSVTGYLFGDVVLGSIRTGAQRYDRSNAKIGRDGQDQYVLQFYLGGHCRARDGGPEACTQPGDMFIVDAAQALATETTQSEFINLAVPRRLLAPLLTAPDQQSMRVIRGADPAVALLREHLGALYRHAPQMTRTHAQAVMPATLQLAASALNASVSPEHVPAVQQCAFVSICRYVEKRLTDPQLNAQSVAHAFGISRATLYRLFEQEGGFATYVRERRLRRCRQMLADPARRIMTIADIAAAHGFTDAANFTRAFRRSIGLSPRAVRMLALNGDTEVAKEASADDWRYWMALMR
ncbi:helix-turn-helix domain-containing protein [Paraburkholderia sp. CNPSo 3272]|uniref:helix-turn-helix domain-containing protein n=1 Tax=Paraburkholderia sp. CNPSo 3272 TaxID=2940931 RepID=UPI0020B71967|nr:helix-turn-helix domain-containing protein [Paraburkholderia sp. CNPSo 3272]MCP3723561.1 helix-turn-helix domain-containing protein [Paraburkholderia sp. CNPSo 3272]